MITINNDTDYSNNAHGRHYMHAYACRFLKTFAWKTVSRSLMAFGKFIQSTKWQQLLSEKEDSSLRQWTYFMLAWVATFTTCHHLSWPSDLVVRDLQMPSDLHTISWNIYHISCSYQKKRKNTNVKMSQNYLQMAYLRHVFLVFQLIFLADNVQLEVSETFGRGVASQWHHSRRWSGKICLWCSRWWHQVQIDLYHLLETWKHYLKTAQNNRINTIFQYCKPQKDGIILDSIFRIQLFYLFGGLYIYIIIYIYIHACVCVSVYVMSL